MIQPSQDPGFGPIRHQVVKRNRRISLLSPLPDSIHAAIVTVSHAKLSLQSIRFRNSHVKQRGDRIDACEVLCKNLRLLHLDRFPSG